ncbi:bifunctional homocysteine S-methyltransferase/methylenetetrahydrofolate reductase [Lentisphaerota bacterium WC36G]|nr:bifunctional homocysteine S-methyltransferase/methylenetetrahydrofolate reductase [Lentisphaerae bacterium WC36]
MKKSIKNNLEEQIVIFDGGIGTEIYKNNFFVNTSFEGLNLSNANVICGIHKDYLDAGAEVITTNSYGANFLKLSKFGLGDKVKEINAAAVALAKQAIEECDIDEKEIYIAGSVGPIKDHSVATASEDDCQRYLLEQVNYLAEAGADFIIFESLSSLEDIERAIVVGNQAKIDYVLSFSLDRNAETARGESFDYVLKIINDLNSKTIAIGLNCGNGAESTLATLENIVNKVSLPLIVQPNAGTPKNIDDRLIYMTNPEYLTTYAVRYVSLGAHGIGGCCGTSPDHIADITRSVKPLAKSQANKKISEAFKVEEELLPEISLQERSKLGAKLATGQWIKSIEITPPRGFDLGDTIEKARKCAEAGIDVINIPDGPRASSRISPIITAIDIYEQAGIEPVLHFCCRDKNLISMQADLLGCAAKDINNILFVTGDPPKLGDYPFASAVFDVDSIGILKIKENMNRGVDFGGKKINAQTKLVAGVGADPNALDMERELRRTREKAAAGAEFIITQPVFSVEPLIEFIEHIKDLNIPVIAGIWPLASYRNAEFMKNEVPGVFVPDEIMKRMASVETREEQREMGIKIARECVDAIRDYVQGIQVSAPFGNIDTALRVF